MAWGTKLLNRFQGQAAREFADQRMVVADESAATKLEQREAADETTADTDVEAFRGGLLKEDALIRRLGQLQREKFTVLKVLSATKAATVRLSMAKRTLLTRLAIGGKRIRQRLVQVRYGGIGTYSPRTGADIELWMQEQGNEIVMLERELASQIKDLEEEASSVAPTLQLIKQQRGVLDEYKSILIDEDRRLIDVAGRKMDEINAARQQFQEERDALQKERDAWKRQRVTGRRS